MGAIQTPPDFLLIDLFCGAGGTTTGAEKSGVCKVIAAINHDPMAIKSHEANHADVLHMQEDILVADTSVLVQCVLRWKARYPQARVILWASLECTNFSNAKGGLPRDADSRALACGMFRYLDALDQYLDYFWIENVKEFMAWGELDEKGKPVSKQKGRDYLRWVKEVQSYGYHHDWRMLCAADFGGVTIRTRYFGAFWKRGRPFAWPQPTHAKKASKGNIFADTLKPWRPVADVLDFTDIGLSIFNRRKPLVDKTLSRILSGLKKFHPNPTVKALVNPMILGYYTRESAIRSIQDPAPTIPAQDRNALVTPMIQSYYSGSKGLNSTSDPAPTVTTKDRLSMVSPLYFIDRQFSSGKPTSIDKPVGALLTNPKTSLCTAFLVPSSFDNQPRTVSMPAPTILASRKHINIATAFVVNPQYRSAGSSVHAPCPTVIAAQKSYPLSLATVINYSEPRWQLQEGDSQVMIQLKTFMRENGIADIYMRMLKLNELKRIQGFPDDYILHGTLSDKKKFIGNSVETNVVAAWIKAIHIESLQIT